MWVPSCQLLFGPRKDGKEGSQQPKGKKRKKPSSAGQSGFGEASGKGGGKAKAGEERREGARGIAAKLETNGQPGSMRIAGADMGAKVRRQSVLVELMLERGRFKIGVLRTFMGLPA
jgi:hypothetical protein